MSETTTYSDLVIVGAGLAGLSAACFAARRGIQVRVIAASGGELTLAGGALDVLGYHPAKSFQQVHRVWDEVDDLIAECPGHPYALAGRQALERAVTELLEVLAGENLPYRGRTLVNSPLLTPAGTFKPTFRMPRTMWPMVTAQERRESVLTVSFEGMKEFSARMIAENAGTGLGGMFPVRLPFPESSYSVERNNQLMAMAMETEPVRERVAAMIREHRGTAAAVAMPAILGCDRSLEVVSDLEERIGLPVFEIPTLPPSVPGNRLHNALERALKKLQVEILSPFKVEQGVIKNGRVAALVFDVAGRARRIEAKGFLLATGRFLGGGLSADRTYIREPIFDLAVRQPGSRSRWHRNGFLDAEGHPVNGAGVAVDRSFRPVDENGRVRYRNLFAAGSLLAHQDWMRTLSGGGLATGTALAAVTSFRDRLL